MATGSATASAAPAAEEAVRTGRPSSRWRRGIGVFLGVLALAYYGEAVLRVDYLRSKLIDLHPNPDAAEYYAMARAMANGEPPQIQIGDERLPARYPPGYSVLMLPWLEILPENRQILAPFRTNQTTGLLLLGSLWIFYWRNKRPLEAGVAALLLATLPGFVAYARSSMSEISGIALVAWAFMAAYQGLETQRRKWIYLCAGLLGLAVNVKTQFLLFGPLLSAMAWIGERRRWRAWLLHNAGVLLFFACCASPIFILDSIQFGNPWKTGYVFWVPEKMEMAFSIRHFRPVVAGLWAELRQHSSVFTATHLFGTGTHVTPAYLLLAAIGVLVARTRKFMLCAGLAGGCLVAQALFFYYSDGRMFLSIFVLLVPLATAATVWAIHALARKSFGGSLPILTLFLLAIAGFPSQSGYPPKVWRSQFADSLRRIPLGKPRNAPHYAAARELIAQAGDRPGAVLSTLNPAFLNAILPAGFAAAPLDGNHHYSVSRAWTYGTPDAVRFAQRTMAQGRPVYALFPAGQNKDRSRLPIVPGYRWEPLPMSKGKAAVLRLQAEKPVPR